METTHNTATYNEERVEINFKLRRRNLLGEHRNAVFQSVLLTILSPTFYFTRHEIPRAQLQAVSRSCGCSQPSALAMPQSLAPISFLPTSGPCSAPDSSWYVPEGDNWFLLAQPKPSTCSGLCQTQLKLRNIFSIEILQMSITLTAHMAVHNDSQSRMATSCRLSSIDASYLSSNEGCDATPNDEDGTGWPFRYAPDDHLCTIQCTAI